jgi:hypothetical protein
MAQLRENGPTGDNSAVLKVTCYGAAAALRTVTMAANLKFGLTLGSTPEDEGHLRHRQRRRRCDQVHHGYGRDPALAETPALVGGQSLASSA